MSWALLRCRKCGKLPVVTGKEPPGTRCKGHENYCEFHEPMHGVMAVADEKVWDMRQRGGRSLGEQPGMSVQPG